MADAQAKMDHHEPPTMVVPPLMGLQRWVWAKRHDYSRLEREYSAFKVELALLQSRDGRSHEPWAAAANCQMQDIKNYLLKKDVEAGWHCLHAARRYAVHALNLNELQIQASALRAEAAKFTSWRAKEMEKLLSVREDQLHENGLIEAAKFISSRGKEMGNLLCEDKQISTERNSLAVLKELVIKAMQLRDEYFTNQYAKVWLMGSQLSTLLVSCGIGLVLLAPFLVSSSRHEETTLGPWAYQVVAAVLFFGLLGAAISAAGSLMNDRVSGIPERVGNQFVTNARAWFGAGVGLAGYAFYQSKLLNINIGSDHSSAAFAVAFLFGFAGELLIVRVLGSVGAGK